MFQQLGKNLWATKIFFLVRFVAAALVGLVYLLIAAGIQYIYVSWFGETTFNYIMGGIFSLYLGALACSYFGRLCFMFIRGWHMAALAFSKQITKKNLPALEVGMTVFRKHLSSFAVVYGTSMLIKKFADKGAESLWELLKDVPYLCSLERFAKNPIVVKLGRDILDTAFDGVIYYIVKYTKPGLGDDLGVIPEALKRYLYALPQVMLSSLTSYFLFYFVPKIVKWAVIISLVWNNGLVAGILLNVLFYPLFYVIHHAIFEPLQTVIMISCYSKHCQEEPVDDSVYRTIVDKILDAIGLSEILGEEPAEEDTSETVEAAFEKVREEVIEEDGPDAILDVTPVFEDEPVSGAHHLHDLISHMERPEGLHDDPDVSTLPLADDEPWSSSSPANLNSLISQAEENPNAPSRVKPPEEDDDADDVAPVTRLSSLMSGISPSALQEAFGAVLGVDSGLEEEESNPLGGGHIDLL